MQMRSSGGSLGRRGGHNRVKDHPSEVLSQLGLLGHQGRLLQPQPDDPLVHRPQPPLLQPLEPFPPHPVPRETPLALLHQRREVPQIGDDHPLALLLAAQDLPLVLLSLLVQIRLLLFLLLASPLLPRVPPAPHVPGELEHRPVVRGPHEGLGPRLPVVPVPEPPNLVGDLGAGEVGPEGLLDAAEGRGVHGGAGSGGGGRGGGGGVVGELGEGFQEPDLVLLGEEPVRPGLLLLLLTGGRAAVVAPGGGRRRGGSAAPQPGGHA